MTLSSFFASALGSVITVTVLTGVPALSAEPSGHLQQASCNAYAGSPCPPKVVVEMSPPEVVFQQAPSPEPPCEKKRGFLKRHCPKSPPPLQAVVNPTATIATITPASLVPFQAVNTVGAAPSLFATNQAVSPHGLLGAGGNPAAQLAALQAYFDVEVKSALASIEDQKRGLNAQLSIMSTGRAQGQAAAPQSTDALTKEVQEIRKQVDQLITDVGRIVDLQGNLAEKVQKLEIQVGKLPKSGTDK